MLWLCLAENMALVVTNFVIIIMIVSHHFNLNDDSSVYLQRLLSTDKTSAAISQVIMLL